MHQEFLNMLEKDHKEVKGLLEKLKKAGNGDSKKRDELFAKVKAEITPHMEAEEKILYPPLKKNEETKEDALESIEEHHVTKMVLRELDSMNKGSDQWMAKLKVFKELVEHHIEEEENEIFSGVKKVFSNEEMKGIMQEFKKEKETVKGRMA